MKPVVDFVRSLPRSIEFGLVLAIAFGDVIIRSIATMSAPPVGLVTDDAYLWDLVIWEVLVLGGLGSFLFVRGWDFARQPLYPSLEEAGVGLGLAAVTVLIWNFYWSIVLSMSPQTQSYSELVQAGWPSIVVTSIINPMFEEWLVCAYLICALRPRVGVTFAICASVAIRTAYHTYQGAESAIGIALSGILFAAWFARTGKLWPVIIAHAALDFMALAQMKVI